MKPLDGVDLATELTSTEAELLEERRREVRQKIRSVLGRTYEGQGTVTKLRKDLAKAEESLTKHQARLQRIQTGDWNALGDEQGKNEKGAPEATDSST